MCCRFSDVSYCCVITADLCVLSCWKCAFARKLLCSCMFVQRMKNACHCVCSVHEQRAGADQLHAERTVAARAEHGEPAGDEGRDRQLLR